jgi:hypothetical protein
MTAHTHWTDEMVARAVGMKRAGLATGVIAKRLGVSAPAVAGKMRAIGVFRTLTRKGGIGPNWGRLMRSFVERADEGRAE